jgi:predicted nucleic acid-binding protein
VWVESPRGTRRTSGSDFLDTTILVYAIETGGPHPDKSAIALRLARRDDICLSTQVLGEFYRVVTSRRRAKPATHDEAVAWVQLWKGHDVRPITAPHVDLALELTGRYRVGYYDALTCRSGPRRMWRGVLGGSARRAGVRWE